MEDFVTSLISWNSVVSIPFSNYVCVDVKRFDLKSCICQLKLILKSFIDEYNFQHKAKYLFAFIETIKGMYIIPQAGILANQLLELWLARYGHYEVPHTPGLSKNLLQSIQFTLVVGDFCIKCTNKNNDDHIFNVVKNHKKVKIIWTGGLWFGIMP